MDQDILGTIGRCLALAKAPSAWPWQLAILSAQASLPRKIGAQRGGCRTTGIFFSSEKHFSRIQK